MAESKEKRRRVGRARTRHAAFGRRRLRLVWLLAAVGLAVYLYYRPIASYLDTRNQLAQEFAAVPTIIAARGAAQSPTKIEASHFIVVVLFTRRQHTHRHSE